MKSFESSLINYVAMKASDEPFDLEVPLFLERKESELRKKIEISGQQIKTAINQESKITRRIFDIKKISKTREKSTIFNSYFSLKSLRKENFIKRFLRRVKLFQQHKIDSEVVSKFKNGELFPPFSVDIQYVPVSFSSFNQNYVEWLLEDAGMCELIRAFCENKLEREGFLEEIIEEGDTEEIALARFYLEHFVEINQQTQLTKPRKGVVFAEK